jgi:hypothetical protein
MGIFQRNRPNHVLFLMPVRLANEKLPKGKTRMLYCDASGKVYASVINESVYELARDVAEKMERGQKSFAIVGLETSPVNFMPVSVEVNATEAWALELILEHALKNGRLPYILKKCIKPIIVRGEASLEAVLSENVMSPLQAHTEPTPQVLNRLPYYSEQDIEFSVPIYKSAYSYPLVVLKQLPPAEPTLHNSQRLLILDSEGDLAVVTVPYQFMDTAEKEIKERNKKKSMNECMIISKQQEGLAMDYMAISQAQRKALDTITRYFEEATYGRQSISAAARTVLDRARDMMSPPDR